MKALMACRSCGFVARRSSEVGARGRCPHCERKLEPVTLAAARNALVQKRERAQAALAAMPSREELPREERG